MKPLPERIEAHCPRCSAAFVLAPATLGRKIQCPKCRQTVAIGMPEVVPAENLPTSEEYADLKVRLAQQSALIEQLRPPTVPDAEVPATVPDADVPAMKPESDTPPGDTLLQPGQSLRWLRRDTIAPGTANDDDEQHAVLLHNLRAMGRRDIVMEIVLDDQFSRSLEESLSAIFREAGWTVHESPPRPQRSHGLVLAAGQCPLPQTGTATYMALKAAGFPITSRLDSALGSEQSILIVGSAEDRVS